ncbi:SubName: Full=Uncharacterized protein {ECO:0000313/EMBL:CCA72350.1} [Serendipita indica DSM 11827]|nr:SubName: Full=Uncharacterized protein {ECO:0000313/EMBL:CCA72350.1} [Serendipita indica DSM 11827]
MSKQIHLDNKRSPVVDEYHFSRLNDALEPYARYVLPCSATQTPRSSSFALFAEMPCSSTAPYKVAGLAVAAFDSTAPFRRAHRAMLPSQRVYASYHLTFAPTSQVVVRALDAQHTCGQDHHCEDEKVALERASACDPSSGTHFPAFSLLDYVMDCPPVPGHTATVLVLHDTPVLVAS